MRRSAIIMAALAFALQACVPGALTGDAATGDAPILGGDESATLTRDDPLKPALVDASEPLGPAAEATEVKAALADAGARPKPRPGAISDVAAEAPSTVVPAAEKGREQIRCEKAKGRWQPIGGGAGHICVRPTRDGGKSCEREGQCDGQCLARSKTCAPFDPLWGCNDVLQADGNRVTLCLN
jgi:hypothetical protein